MCVSGFRRGINTTDAITDRVTDLEEAKPTFGLAFVISLDVYRTLDFLPHTTFLCRFHEVVERIYAFIAVFVCDWSLAVRECGIVGSLRNTSQGYVM